MNFKQIKVSIVFLFISFASSALSNDIIKWPKDKASSDPRSIYKTAVLIAALDKSVSQYGPYDLQEINLGKMTNPRAREVLREGESINVYGALTSPEWEEITLPIRIPIRRGLLNYRLLLIHQNDIDKFKDITSQEQLKKLKVGLRIGWSTTGVLEAAQFNVVHTKKYDGMFLMLDGGRFDYIPRGVNEIFKELELNKNLEIIVEPNLIMYLPAPTYFFVSPKNPRIAERIEAGLEMMVADGTLKAIFKNAYENDMKKANLTKRTLINVTNPFLSPETPLNRPELWYKAADSN